MCARGENNSIAAKSCAFFHEDCDCKLILWESQPNVQIQQNKSQVADKNYVGASALTTTRAPFYCWPYRTEPARETVGDCKVEEPPSSSSPGPVLGKYCIAPGDHKKDPKNQHTQFTCLTCTGWLDPKTGGKFFCVWTLMYFIPS